MPTQSTKDYYAILGVYPTAEDIVIRAAYRALAQRYHPDKFDGPRDVAEARMKELNEAYVVLADPGRREEYDRSRESAGEAEGMGDDESEADFAEAGKTLDDDWAFASDYYGDLDAIFGRLTKFSSRLAFAYRVAMLEGKDFDRRWEIAEAMETEFLIRFFGKNAVILAFAKEVILNGKRAAAKELNRAVNILGTTANPDAILRRIREKYGLATGEGPMAAEKGTRNDIADIVGKIERSYDYEYVRILVELLGGQFDGHVRPGRQFGIFLWGKQLQFRTAGDLRQWAQSGLVDEVRTRYGGRRCTGCGSMHLVTFHIGSLPHVRCEDCGWTDV